MKKVSHKVRSSVKRVSLRSRASMLVTASLLVACTTAVPTLRSIVVADQYQDQINALNAQNANSRAAVNDLLVQAAGYQDAINKLQTQIDGLQASINANIALQADLQKQIQAAQDEIDRQRAILASDVKAMYVDGTPDPVVMMATSKNLSDFVDKQEYRARVQGKLQTTLKKIAALQKQLQVQKAKVESLLKEQQSQQARLDADRAQQQSLLNMNEGQQAAYNSQIADNNAKVAQLKVEQAIANRRLSGGGAGVTAGDPNKGGYPAIYANAAQDSMVDRWGMYNRECVSYAAWKVEQAYGYMPYWGGVGNANQWPGNARAAGIPTSNTPAANTVAISLAGYYGHAMWVEYVLPNGGIHVSQYNYNINGIGWGQYSEMDISPSVASSLIYIHFR